MGGYLCGQLGLYRRLPLGGVQRSPQDCPTLGFGKHGIYPLTSTSRTLRAALEVLTSWHFRTSRILTERVPVALRKSFR